MDYPQPNMPTISVSLTGFVETPGVYQMLPINRLSDLIARSMIASAPQSIADEAVSAKANKRDVFDGTRADKDALKPDYKKLQALRSVQINSGGKRQYYDLLRFYRMGDDTQNPYLKDGDVVLISALKDFVSISGGVNLPGDIEFVSGDKLQDIIGFAKGTSYDADLEAVQIYRFGSNKVDFEIISLNLLSQPSDYGFLLQAGDNCIVPRMAEVSKRLKVKIDGQVKNPGEYVISPKSTLAELIQQAGGANNRADLANLIHYNSAKYEQDNPYLNQLMQRTRGDMSPLEYTYLRTNLQQMKGKYSFDVKKFAETGGKEANPTLRDGDAVFIPERMDMVFVSGQVRHPGLVPYSEGKNWDYYITLAGGYTNNRKHAKGRIIRGDSGNWIKPNKGVPILAGDTVFVPSQTDRALWTDVKEGITLVSSLITIIVGLRALTTN